MSKGPIQPWALANIPEFVWSVWNTLIFENMQEDTSSFTLNVLDSSLEKAAKTNYYNGIKTEWLYLHKYYRLAGWTVEEVYMDYYTLYRFSI